MGRPAGAAAVPRPGPVMAPRAVILTGSLGMGHDVLAEIVTGSLDRLGWQTRTLDCMRMLGPRAGRAGEWVFRGLAKVPGAYDALHFAALRPGNRLAAAMDGAAEGRLMTALRAELGASPAELIISVFAAGVPAAARLATSGPGRSAIVLCPDALPHASWVRDGIRLYLVTSAAAAASVRRYQPDARVTIVPPPVRAAFSAPLSQAAGRRLTGVPPGARCVLLMGGGWGLGPLEEAARALSGAGVHVLAVAGHNRRLERRLADLARRDARVHPFGFTDQIPGLMAASDLVVTLPGALTCGEARAAGRPLMLLDAMPGHGRENLQHELDLGGADVSNPRPADLTRGVLAALDRMTGPAPPGPGHAEWHQAFAAALAGLGTSPPPRRPGPPGEGPPHGGLPARSVPKEASR